VPRASRLKSASCCCRFRVHCDTRSPSVCWRRSRPIRWPVGADGYSCDRADHHVLISAAGAMCVCVCVYVIHAEHHACRSILDLRCVRNQVKCAKLLCPSLNETALSSSTGSGNSTAPFMYTKQASQDVHNKLPCIGFPTKCVAEFESCREGNVKLCPIFGECSEIRRTRCRFIRSQLLIHIGVHQC